MSETSYECSFCNKPSADVEVLIVSSDDIRICSDCVEQCNKIIQEYRECTGPKVQEFDNHE